MNGTAADMNIEENLALCGTPWKTTFSWLGEAKRERNIKNVLALLGLGLGRSYDIESRTFVRRTASGSHTFNGIPQKTEAVTFR